MIWEGESPFQVRKCAGRVKCSQFRTQGGIQVLFRFWEEYWLRLSFPQASRPSSLLRIYISSFIWIRSPSRHPHGGGWILFGRRTVCLPFPPKLLFFPNSPPPDPKVWVANQVCPLSSLDLIFYKTPILPHMLMLMDADVLTVWAEMRHL
jgi:hypothetical protein